MAQNVDALPNPVISSEQHLPTTEASRETPAASAPLSNNNNDYEAANALAALANFGSGASYAPVHNHHPSPPTSVTGDQKPSLPTHGHDASHVISPPSDGAVHLPVAPDATQLRIPGYVRDEPTALQIRQPSPAQSLIQDLPISPSKIKAEPSTTPRSFTPSATPQVGPVDTQMGEPDTLKTVAELKNEHGLRGHKDSPPATPVDAPKPAPKKRSAPKSVGKKTTTKKPPSKKRRLEVDTANTNGQSADRRSNTPSSRTRTPALGSKSKKSQTGTPIVGSSPAAMDDGSDGEATDSEDDQSLYCICRGKDDHTWMIGCEACDDWFHGRCVNLNREEHEKLLAKFICPNCEQAGRGHTTWRPMCRREGCMLPAATFTETKIVDGKKTEVLNRSKYCSNECGITFFKNIIAAISYTANSGPPTKGRGSSRRKNTGITNLDLDLSEDDYEPPPRGGVLRAKDLKSLVDTSDSVATFHRLGSGFVSPLASNLVTQLDSAEGGKASNGEGDSPPYALTESESERLSQLSAEKNRLRCRRAMLRDRERFITMTREAANRHAEREGMKPKEVCGYDPRLAWSEEEFRAWRNTPTGRAALSANTLEPTEDDIAQANSGEDAAMTDADAVDTAMNIDALENSRPQPCTRKRCERHKAWEKLHLHDLRFEDVEVLHALKKYEGEEKDIHEKAMVRWRREKAMEGLTDHDPDSKRHGEGWVEVVG